MTDFDKIRNIIIDYDEGKITDEHSAFEAIRQICFENKKSRRTLDEIIGNWKAPDDY